MYHLGNITLPALNDVHMKLKVFPTTDIGEYDSQCFHDNVTLLIIVRVLRVSYIYRQNITQFWKATIVPKSIKICLCTYIKDKKKKSLPKTGLNETWRFTTDRSHTRLTAELNQNKVTRYFPRDTLHAMSIRHKGRPTYYQYSWNIIHLHNKEMKRLTDRRSKRAWE